MKTSILVVALFVTSVAAIAQPSDVRQGLVAYWQMESTPDGVITPDATPFSNHLSLVSMNAGNFVSGRFGNAAMLNGSSTYMTNLHGSDNGPTGLPIYRAGSYTITLWVNGGPQTAKYLFSEGSTASTAPLLILQTGQAAANNAKFDVIIRNDANGALVNHVVSGTVVFNNAWHHIAWVDDRGSVRLYVDGVLDTANFNYTPSGTFTFNTTAIGTLIRATISTGAIFNGLIDDVGVWERALTQSEVQQVMTSSMQAPVPVLPAYIVRQPSRPIFAIGDRVTFRAAGGRPFSYQWAKDGLDISGATASSLTLANLTTNDSGDYTVRTETTVGPLTSAASTLLVRPDPTNDLPRGLVSFWPFEELIIDEGNRTSTPDVYSRNDIELFPQPFLDQIGGIFGGALSFNGIDQYGTRSGGFPIYNNTAYSVSFWVHGAAGQIDKRIFAEGSTNNNNPLFGFGTHASGADGTIRVYIRNDNNVVLRDRNSTRVVLDNTWHHVVWTDTNGQAKLYIDGILDESEFDYTRSVLTANQTAVAALARVAVSNYFAGGLDELAVWNRALTFGEIQEIHTNSVPTPISIIPPDITQQPTNQSVFTRGTASFSVVAVGTAPLYAQWRKNGVAITDATNFSLIFTNAALTNSGDYDIVITNAAGSITSHVATLTVTVRPPPPNDLKIDFNNIGQEGPSETQLGFESFAITAFGAGPFRRAYGGTEVAVSAVGAGVILESRLRATPVNSATLTEGQLFRDFIFSRDSTVDHGIDIAVEFLESNQIYDGTIWSFDSGSTAGGDRISDWTVNGSLVQTAYAFNGANLPTADGQYRINFIGQADVDGKILIQGRRSASATVALNVFINALQLTVRDIRVLRTELITAENTLKLTVKLRDPAASHRLVEKTNITDPNWTEAVDAVYFTPVNGVQEITVPVGNPPTRFFKVVQTD